jgi:hypothetical protein
MGTVNQFVTGKLSIASARYWVVALAFGTLSLGCVQAQTAPAKGNAEPTPESTGFSIESEMLTYRALQSNSEAIACDIAAYLNGTTADFKTPPAGSICDVKAGTKKASVVLLPFDSSEFADFQIWRADMATMDKLQRKAEKLGCSGNEDSNSKGATAAVNAAISASPAGPPLAVAQGVLALLASEQSTTSVTGTIHDQAFMNGVGRVLQELKVPVLMPTAYTPYSLTLLDRSNSPYLADLDRTMTAHGCLEGLAANPNTKNKDSVQRAISDIQAFLNTITEGAAPAPKDPKAPAVKPGEGNPPAKTPDGTESPEVSSAVTATAPYSSHLTAALLADGLAAKLGVDPKTGALSYDDEESTHILLIKALESGGSVTRYNNILGTKISYSGGSVGTYALFTMDGDLECSGIVYEYGGSIKAKDFQEQLRGYTPDPARQMVFLRHSCRPVTPP